MRKVTTPLKSVSIYSSSKYIRERRGKDETDQDFEDRIWRKRCHVDADGVCFVPPMAFKFALAAAAVGEKTGTGRQTWAKSFASGLIVQDGLSLGVKPEDVRSETFMMSSTGDRGKGKRVARTFPMFDSWQDSLIAYVLDDTITQDAFQQILEKAGRLVGVGRFRPEVGGFNGRFVLGGEPAWEDLD